MRFRETVSTAAVAAAWCAACCCAAHAGAVDPFNVTAVNPWPQNLAGGYLPVIVKVENLSEPVEAMITLTPRGGYGNGLATVERPVSLGRAETARVAVPVPVSDGGRYEVQVYVGGYQTLQRPPYVDVPYVHRYGERSGTIVIAVSQAAPDRRTLEAVLTSMGSGTASVVHVTPDQLPDLWQPYSSIGMCVVDVDALTRLMPAQRSALGQWVFAGGVCLVHPVSSAGERELIVDGLGLAGAKRGLVVPADAQAGMPAYVPLGIGRCMFAETDAFPMTEAWWRRVVSDASLRPIADRVMPRSDAKPLEIPASAIPPSVHSS